MAKYDGGVVMADEGYGQLYQSANKRRCAACHTIVEPGEDYLLGIRIGINLMAAQVDNDPDLLDVTEPLCVHCVHENFIRA